MHILNEEKTHQDEVDPHFDTLGTGNQKATVLFYVCGAGSYSCMQVTLTPRYISLGKEAH